MGKDAGGYFNVSYRFSSRIFGMFSSLKILRINLFCIIIVTFQSKDSEIITFDITLNFVVFKNINFDISILNYIQITQVYLCKISDWLTLSFTFNKKKEHSLTRFPSDDWKIEQF